ncbi:MAG: hypothetical protein N4A44_01000 [Alphaproteobacteria bacterium]|nr:hypothetical protein [Alphaproteobacteria bacterium]
MEKNYKKYSKIFLFTIIAPIYLYIIISYINDPLMIFHKPFFNRDVVLYEDARTQNAGVINSMSEKFDSIIFGTSMIQNTSADFVSKKLGGTFANISMSGGSFDERAVVLDYLFKKKKNLKSIVYSFDGCFIDSDISNTSNYSYLYDDNKFNDFKIYFNDKYILKNILFSGFKLKNEKQLSLNYPYNWFSHKRHIATFGGVDKWVEYKSYKRIMAAMNDLKETSTKKILIDSPDENFKDQLETSKKYIEKYLIKYIEKYPNTNFYIIMPPYFRGRFAKYIRSQNLANIHYGIVRYMANLSDKYKNLKFYAFEDMDYLDDISNYKDTSHYNIDMNNYQINSIKEGRHLITSKNVDKYIKISKEKVINFDIIKLNDEIQKKLNKKKCHPVEDDI